MSILIKGMDTPDIDNNKRIKAEIRNLDDKLELGIMTGGYYCSQQWTYYPIVSVPAPHGRLIDADALEKDAEWSDYYDEYTAYSECQIGHAPIVIEAEE